MKFIHTGDIHWGMTPDADKPWGSERAQAIKDTFKKIIAQAGKMQTVCSSAVICSIASHWCGT